MRSRAGRWRRSPCAFAASRSAISSSSTAIGLTSAPSPPRLTAGGYMMAKEAAASPARWVAVKVARPPRLPDCPPPDTTGQRQSPTPAPPRAGPISSEGVDIKRGGHDRGDPNREDPGSRGRLGWRVERRPRPGFGGRAGAAGSSWWAWSRSFVEAEHRIPRHRASCCPWPSLSRPARFFRAPGPIRAACVTATVLAVPASALRVLRGRHRRAWPRPRRTRRTRAAARRARWRSRTRRGSGTGGAGGKIPAGADRDEGQGQHGRPVSWDPFRPPPTTNATTPTTTNPPAAAPSTVREPGRGRRSTRHPNRARARACRFDHLGHVRPFDVRALR